MSMRSVSPYTPSEVGLQFLTEILQERAILY
jgi:hypothetical protein